MNELIQKYVKELFDYHAGNLYWKVHRQSIQKGDKAGSLSKNSRYYRIGINQKNYSTHQIIYLYHYGYLPKEIDHIDGNKINNKIENLREVTHQENLMNQKPRKNTSSKYKGVSWFKRDQKWKSQIVINSKSKYLGLFKSEKDAALAYNEAAIKYHGKYAKLNIIKEE